MMKLLVLCSFLIASQALSDTEVLRSEWDQYKIQYGKSYPSPIEDVMRFQLFLQTKHTIALHNEKYAKGEVTYEMGVNQFADLTKDEFHALNGLIMSARTFYDSKSVNCTPPSTTDLPAAVDWRQKNAVTGVQDQGICGSCYAFSVAGAIESAIFIKTGELKPLSKQNLMTCNNNSNCCGGNFIRTFDSAITCGISHESDVPYEPRPTLCSLISPVKISGYCQVQRNQANLLKAVVAKIGPVSVSMDGAYLQSYKGGVFYNNQCNPLVRNHAVLLVGYNTTDDGTDYWIVKNSWGETWGEQGYFKIAMSGDCGFEYEAFYPVV